MPDGFLDNALAQWQAVVARTPQLLESLQPRMSKYVPHKPTPKQAAFLLLNCREAFYGGAAGGGKSDALLMAALQYVDVPGYAALILRRTFSDLNLPNAIMDRAKQWLMGFTEVKWSEKEKTFRFPSGATLTFGFLDNENDKYRYQGSEIQFCAFDELTQFPQSNYQYLFSRLRKPKDMPVPIRMRAASNPGGTGHAWVKERFILHKNTADRVFISASVKDNPFINQDEYVGSLQELDPVTKARLLEGDWMVEQAGLVYPEFERRCVVAPRPLPEGTHYGGIDFGFHNPFAAICGVLDHDGVLWIYFERYKRQMTVAEHAAHLPTDGDITWFADPAGAENIAQLRKLDFTVQKAMNKKDAGIPLVNDWIRKGRLKVFSTCVALRQEAGMYSYPESTQVKVPEGGDPTTAVADPSGVKSSEEPIKENDHAMDALRYLIAGIARRHGEHVVRDVEELTEPVAVEELPKPFDRDNWHSIDNPAFWQGPGTENYSITLR